LPRNSKRRAREAQQQQNQQYASVASLTGDKKARIPHAKQHTKNSTSYRVRSRKHKLANAVSECIKSATMRKIVLGLGISLDGYIARSDGDVDFLSLAKKGSGPPAKNYSMGPFFKTVDVAIMGRKTYEVGLKLSGGKFDNYGMKCYVCSRSQTPGERGGVTFVNDSPKVLVDMLRKHPGKDIWHMGGGELAREFLKDDLIDELYIGVVPILIGEGIPLFPAGFPQREFRLLENGTYSGGLIALRYERLRTKQGESKQKKDKSPRLKK
jgi:dihydrofolate reductase